MALTRNFFAGAESGDLHEAFGTTGSPSASSAQTRSGGFSYLIDNSGDHIDFAIFQSVADAGGDYIVGFGYYAVDATPGSNHSILIVSEAGTQVFKLHHLGSGFINILDSDNNLIRTTDTTQLQDATWHYIEVHFQHSASAIIEVFVDGVSQGSDSAEDLTQSGTMDLLEYYGFTTNDVFYDDIYFKSGASSAADRDGGGEALAFRSDEDTSTADWIKGSDGDSNIGSWNNTQEIPFNDGVDLIYNDTTARAGGIDTDDGLTSGPQDAVNPDTGATSYFDASDAGPTDNDSNWNSDSLAFDGVTGTSNAADAVASGTRTTNELRGEGTTAPASGGVIGLVRARAHGDGSASGIDCEIWTDGEGTLLGTPVPPLNEGWGAWVNLAIPSGGWTWAKVQALETIIIPTTSGDEVSRIEVEVFIIKTINTPVAMKGFWRMKRSGGGGTTHFGLMGNTGSAIVDGDRTADFEPPTSFKNFFDVREDNLPLSTEYGRIGIEKDDGGQDFICGDMLFQIWHVPDVAAAAFPYHAIKRRRQEMRTLEIL